MTDFLNQLTRTYDEGWYDAWVATPGYTPLTGPYSVSLAGHQYGIDLSFKPYRRDAFRHRSLPNQRESLNYDNIPGEGVLNTASAWRRDQIDWSLGAGQLFFDHRKSADNRFFMSKGIDPMTTQWQASMLNDTAKTFALRGSQTFVKALMVGQYQYFLEYDTLCYQDVNAPGTYYTVAGLPETGAGHWMFDICANGEYVFVACGTNGIYYWPIGDHTTDGVQYVSGGTFTTPGTLDSSSHDVKIALNAVPQVEPGMSVTGTDIPGSTTVTAVGSTTVTLSKEPTGDGVQELTFSSGSGQEGYTFSKVAWAADYLWATGEQHVYVFGASLNGSNGSAHVAGTPVGAGEMIPDVTGRGWQWTNLVEGNSQIYVGGYYKSGNIGYGGGVYRIGQNINQVANSIGSTETVYTTTTTFMAPVRALQLDPGEQPSAIFTYLNYIFVGSNLGVRMCETLSVYDPTATMTGDLRGGALVPNVLQPVTSAVTGFTANNRWIYFAWCDYDQVSTGIGRMDITNFIDDLTPAYCSHLMVTAQCRSMLLEWDVITHAPMISLSSPTVGDPGVYTITDELVETATLTTGWVTYGIPDDKVLFRGIFGIGQAAGSLEMYVMTDNGQGVISPFELVRQESAIAGDMGDLFYMDPYPRGKRFQYEIVLGRDPSYPTTGPILNRWTVFGQPIYVAAETTISVVLMLFKTVSIHGQQVKYDPYAEYHYLDTLRRNQEIVEYVEGPLSAQVYITSIDWLPEQDMGTYERGYQAVAVVYLQTINGFQFNPERTS